MAAVLTDIGEEWTLETALEGASVSIGLYNDSTDTAGDSTDIGNLTTEPSGASYSRQSVTLTLADSGGDWQAQTGSNAVFDTSDSSQSVDAYFIVANFQSDDASDGSATDHIVATGSLSQTYDLSSVDQLTLNSGTVGFSIT